VLDQVLGDDDGGVDGGGDGFWVLVKVEGGEVEAGDAGGAPTSLLAQSTIGSSPPGMRRRGRAGFVASPNL
jgi:hypothetical protein